MKLAKKQQRVKLILLIIMLAAIVGNITETWAVKEQTKEFYVNDFAMVFSEEQKIAMINRAVNLDKEFKGIQVVVTSVKSFGDYTKEEYATTMYNQYGIGEKDMGVLILLSTGDREIRLETGQAMEPYLTDSRAGRIIDKYGMEYFKQDQFAEGLANIQRAVIDYIQENIPKDWNTEKEEQKSGIQPSDLISKKTTETVGISQSSSKGSGIRNAVSLASIIFSVFIIMYLLKCITNYRNKIEDIEKKKTEEIEKMEKAAQKKFDDMVERNKGILEQLKEEKAEIQADLNSVREDNRELKQKLEALQSRHMKAITLFPNLETAIDEMIEKEFQKKAEGINLKISSVVSRSASKDNVSIFKEALDLYKTASNDVKRYITGDIRHIEDLYNKSERLKAEFIRMEEEKANKKIANDAFERMRPIADKCWQGTHENYEQLVDAENIYLRLNPAQRKMFPNQVWLSAFQSKLDDAKKDYKYYKNAKDAEEKVQETLSRVGTPTEHDIERLKKARKTYKSLSNLELAYFDDELWSKLQRMIRKAEDDHEENERRRRNATMMSTSHIAHHNGGSFGGSSFGGGSHSGHGGSSAGGGAGRSF